MSANITVRKELFGHPIGLYVLFFTEMWERFSYYGMRAILVLYLVGTTTGDNPGLGWHNGDALELYGWYTMLVYVACIPGGLIADNYLGQKKAVMWGAICLVIGHSVLAIEAMWAFYTGLAFIVMGVGMLKANISTMVGGLYKDGDIRRDKAFTIFYIGINLGALLASITVGYVGEKIGWHYGFGLAGIAMALGLVFYLLGQKYIGDVGEQEGERKIEEASKKRTIGQLYGELLHSPKQLVVASILAVFSLSWMVFVSLPNGALFLFLSAVVALMMMVYKDLTDKIMKDRFMVLIIAFLMISVFFSAFEQAGGLMNIYAKNKTDRMLSFDLPFIGNEIPATWFQSLNSIFIIIFGVLIANFWARRKLKSKEASSLFKIAVGTIIMGLGFLFMAGAANEFTPGGGKSAMYWLVFAFLLQTIGELCASPVSLSFVTKLAPIRYASLMMGLYFAATGFGNKIVGIVGDVSQSVPITIELASDEAAIQPFLDSKDNTFSGNKDFTLSAVVYPNESHFEAIDPVTGESILPLIKFDSIPQRDEITKILEEHGVTKEAPYHVDFEFRKAAAADAVNYKLGYTGSFIIQEIQTSSEFKTFIVITIYTGLFGLLIILLLKPLKRLAHGVEEDEHEISDEGRISIE